MLDERQEGVLPNALQRDAHKPARDLATVFFTRGSRDPSHIPPFSSLLHRPQDRMHLDCVFSILGDDVCLMLEEMMGEKSPTRRLVDEYTRDSSGTYSLSRENVEFSQYMRENGYHIIPIKPEHQLVFSPLHSKPTHDPACLICLLHLATAI